MDSRNHPIRLASDPVQIAPRQVNVERLKASYPAFRGRYPNSTDEAQQIDALARNLRTPADPAYIAVCVTTLLHHYYVGELPNVVQDGIARHWLIELAEYPDWAIDAACAWWVGRDNQKRGKKPLPGDIGARAHEVLAPIRTAILQVERYAKFGDNPPEFLKG